MIIRNRSDLARLIKGATAYQGQTLASLGRILGMLQPSVSRLVNRSDIGLSDLLRIGDALGLDLVIEYRERGEQPTTTDTPEQSRGDETNPHQPQPKR